MSGCTDVPSALLARARVRDAVCDAVSDARCTCVMARCRQHQQLLCRQATFDYVACSAARARNGHCRARGGCHVELLTTNNSAAALMQLRAQVRVYAKCDRHPTCTEKVRTSSSRSVGGNCRGARPPPPKDSPPDMPLFAALHRDHMVRSPIVSSCDALQIRLFDSAGALYALETARAPAAIAAIVCMYCSTVECCLFGPRQLLWTDEPPRSLDCSTLCSSMSGAPPRRLCTGT